VKLVERNGSLVPDRLLRAADIAGALGETNNPDWKAVAFDELSGELVAPVGSGGFCWGVQGKCNLGEKAGRGHVVRLRLRLAGHVDAIRPVAFPYFGSSAPRDFVATDREQVLLRNVPVKAITLTDGNTAQVATV